MKNYSFSWARRIVACVVCSLMAFSMVWAERVSEDDAALVANHFMNVSTSSSSAIKKAPAKRMVLKKAAAAEENQFYIYENADGEGWVMVAANDVAHPILAYSHTGQFRTENQPSNLKVWLNGYNRQIKRAEQNGLVADEATKQEWVSLRKGATKKMATEIVSPLVKTGWSQSAPYYNMCPKDGSSRSVTGCVATAMAQVMNYHQWPKQGTGSHSLTVKGTTYTVNFGETTYDWDNMLDHYTALNSQGNEYVISGLTTAQKNAVATLMYHCGVSCDMEYTADVSGAYTIDYNGYWSKQSIMCAETALKNFFNYKVTGYCRDGNSNPYMKKWSKADWIAMLKAELDAARPIMYAGSGCDDPNDDNTCYGHSFVCDGYDSSNYFHFNWGWTNWCDGYYEIDAMVTTDPGTGGGNGEYNLDQDVILLQPNITGHSVTKNATGCSISCASVAENDKAFTATITPTDGTYDFTSLTVKLGSTILTENTHYTLSSDKKELTINASAVSGDAKNDLTITAVWTKNRYKYELLGENSTPEMDEGMLAKNAALNLTITPNSGYTLADAACWDVEMGGVALTYGTGFTYNANTGAFAIAQITGDVAILAYGGKAVTWLANGEQFAHNIALSDKLTLPANEPEGCDGKVFVGWTATADYEHASVAPTKVKDGDAANATTYYAVFATKGEGGASDVKTYTFTSKSWAESTGTWTGTKDGNQYTANQGVQVTTGATGAGAKTSQSFSGVTKAVVNYCTNASKGAGSIDVTIGSTKVSQDVTSTGGTSLRDLEFAFEGASGTATLVVNCTTNSIYVNSITITSGGGASYSNYTTSCTPPCVGELTGITIDTNDAQKEFTEGETFNYGGLVVTANYDGCDSKIVVPTSVSTPDMNKIGQQTVTVSFEGKTATYEITISALPTYTIRFYNNGALVGTAQNVKQGQQPNVPATPSACESYTFGGWLAAALADDVTEKPGYVTDFTATKDQNYYAAYSYTEEGEGGGATEVADELTRATTGVSNGATSYSNWSGKSVNTAVYAGNSAGSNDAIQLRSNNSNSGIVTTTSGGKVAKVTVSWNSNTASGRTLNVYGKNSAYSDATDLYGNASGELLGTIVCGTSTELVIDGDYSYVGVRSNSSAMYLDAITFTWTADGGSSSTTYYTTSPSCEACTAAVTVSKGETENGSFDLDYFGELSTCGGAVTITVTASPADGYRFKEITQTGMTEGVTIDQNAKTVTYAKKSEGASTISVIFEAKPKYTVRFFANGQTLSTQNVIAGEQAELPKNPSAPCDSYQFVGWWTEALAMDNTKAENWISDFTVTQAQDYYAIFSKTEEGTGVGESEVASVTFKTASTDKTQESSDIAADIVDSDSGIAEYSGTKVFAGVNGAKLGTSKLSGSLTLTLASTVNVTAVKINASQFGSDTGTMEVTVGETSLGSQTPASGMSYEAESSIETNTITIETTKRAYIASISVMGEGGTSSVTYYTYYLDCSSTAIETVETNEPVAVKAIINGQIVIIRGEAVYTLTGARVQYK